jgi:hypothetical protein
MSRTIRKTIEHTLPEVAIDACAPVSMGKTNLLETLVKIDVVVLVDFTYAPAEPAGADDPGAPAEVAIRSIKTAHGSNFNGEKMSLFVDSGFDLLEVLPEIEVEKLEEMIIKRAEAK